MRRKCNMVYLRVLSFTAIFAVSLYLLFPPASNRLAVEQNTIVFREGIEIPQFGLGTWLSNFYQVAQAAEFALINGYDHLDSAWIYRNENQTGKGIVASGRPRSSIWVTSKLWNSHHQPAEAEAAIKKSMSDLQVSYLDLYLMHWPVAFLPDQGTKLDLHTSIQDTWRTMESFVTKGYTRHIGISNFDKAQVDALLVNATIRPYAHEFETHPYLQQQDFVDYHKEIGMKVIAYSPLANLNPVYDRGLDSILKDPFWRDLAAEKNATVPQAVLAWGLQRGTVVIPRSTKESHIVENLKAVDIRLTEEEMRAVGEQDKKVRMSNPGKNWGVKLFADLDDPTLLNGDEFDEL